jgi:chromosome segregation ATPase
VPTTCRARSPTPTRRSCSPAVCAEGSLTGLSYSNSAHDETIKQKQTIISDLQTTIDELKRDLHFARSAHEALVVEKGAVESQLSVVRRRAQQTSDALEKKARTSGALQAEMDLVSQYVASLLGVGEE